MIDLTNPIVSVCDKMIRYLPTDQRKLEKYENLQRHIDYEDGDNLKLHLEECRKKTLFRLSTGLSKNPKNEKLFDVITSDRELANFWTPRLAAYFELRDAELYVIEGRMTKLKTKLYFLYWSTIIFFSFVFACLLIILPGRIQPLYIIPGVLLLSVMAIISLLMIGNKQRDMNLIKLFKKKYPLQA